MKREYIKPIIEVYQIKTNNNLLVESNVGVASENFVESGDGAGTILSRDFGFGGDEEE